MDRLSTSELTIPTLTQGLSQPPSSTSTSFSFLGFSMTTWIIIILVLAILGFNIFAYLAKGSQTIAGFFRPFFQSISGIFGSSLANITKQVTNTSATGTKAGVDVAAGTINSAVDVIQQTAGSITGATASSSLVGSQKTNTNTNITAGQDDELTQMLNQAQKQTKNISQQQTQAHTFASDEASSAIQSSKSSSKSGWCYIGEDRGFRSCIQVGENDTCISGDIFPSQDICVNPTLRQ